MTMHLTVCRRLGSVVLEEILCTGVYVGRCADRTHLTDRPHEATCSECRERYETEPQPVTTKDLDEVLAFVDDALLEIGLADGVDQDGVSAVRRRLNVLRAKLDRPRPIKVPEGSKG
jgi:hypothetical protein